jgi:hypothetical protein
MESIPLYANTEMTTIPWNIQSWHGPQTHLEFGLTRILRNGIYCRHYLKVRYERDLEAMSYVYAV